MAELNRNFDLPDVVIVGAPKCGTTSLASYLGAHPRIFMARANEPNYFLYDVPERRAVTNIAAYGALFRGARPGQLRGETSTSYLFSDEAVPAILDANPAAQLIAMVRNPLDMVVSYHAQKVYSLQEEEPRFEAAWQLSHERARNRRVAVRGHSPRYLDYRSIGRLGHQIARLKRWVPPGQLHVVTFDDLCTDPGAVHRRALSFLGLPDDQRRLFPVLNARKVHAWPRLARLLKHPPEPLRWAKRGFPAPVRAAWRRFSTRPAQKPPLSDSLRREMVAAFEDDVALLGALLNRDLRHWMGAPSRR